MVLALNTGLIDPKYGSETAIDNPDAEAEIEIAKAIRLRKQKQAGSAGGSNFPTFGGAMTRLSEKIKGGEGVEKFARGVAATPFRMLGGIGSLAEQAGKDPTETAKAVGKGVVENAKQFIDLAPPTTPLYQGPEKYTAALAKERKEMEEDPGGYTVDKVLEIAGAASPASITIINKAVKAGKIAKEAGSVAKAAKAFASEVVKVAPEITPEQTAKSFSRATDNPVTPEMLSALREKFNKPVAGTPKPPKPKPEVFNEKMMEPSSPVTKEGMLTRKFEGDRDQALTLGSFGDPTTFKQLGQTIMRGVEKIGGGGKADDVPGIRLDNINVGDEVKASVKTKLDEIAKDIQKTKGDVLSHDEVLEAAVSSDLLKGAFNRETALDLEAAMLRTKQNLVALAEENPVGISKQWAEDATKVSAAATHYARVLESQKIPIHSELYEFKMQMLKELTDRGHDLDTIVKVFDGVDFKNAKAVGKAYKTLLPRMEKVRLWIDKFRYTNMLSSPKTHIVNQASNVIQSLLLRPIDRVNLGALDWAKSKLTGSVREAYATDFIPYYRGFVSDFRTAGKEAFDVLAGRRKMEKPDFDRLPLGGAYATVETIPQLMEAADVFTRTLMQSAEMRVGASAKAARKTVDTYLFRNLTDTTNKTGQGIVSSMFDRGTAAAEFLRSDVKLRVNGKDINVWNPAKLLVPFVQTPMNILKEGLIARNPVLGSANLVGNTAKMESVAKMMTGGMILAVAGAYAFNNRSVYKAPESENGKKLFYGAGLKPYSIITPDGNVVSVQRLGSAAYPFVLASATKWYFDKNPQAATEENLEKTTKVLTAYAKFLTDQSYMQGIGTVFDALEGNAKTSTLFAGPAKQFIPLSSLQKWVNDYFLDPVYRNPSKDFDAEGIAAQLYGSMIGMSKKNEAYRDDEGYQEKRDYPKTNAFLPIEVGKIKRDKRRDYNAYLQSQRDRALEKKNRQ